MSTGKNKLVFRRQGFIERLPKARLSRPALDMLPSPTIGMPTTTCTLTFVAAPSKNLCNCPEQPSSQWNWRWTLKHSTLRGNEAPGTKQGSCSVAPNGLPRNLTVQKILSGRPSFHHLKSSIILHSQNISMEIYYHKKVCKTSQQSR